jgi:hypothetical protein
MGQAFDEAWDSIAPNVGNDPVTVAGVRIKLAKAVLSEATSSEDATKLKQAALKVMDR